MRNGIWVRTQTVLNLKYERLVHNSAKVVPLQVFGKFRLPLPYAPMRYPARITHEWVVTTFASLINELEPTAARKSAARPNANVRQLADVGRGPLAHTGKHCLRGG